MDVVYRLGRATALDVLDNLEKPPSYSAVRALLRLLEEHGHVTHTTDGARYVYAPAVPRGVVISMTDCYRTSDYGEPIAALKSYFLSPFADGQYVTAA